MGTALLLRQVRAAKGSRVMLHDSCAPPRPTSNRIRVPLQHKVRLTLLMPLVHKLLRCVMPVLMGGCRRLGMAS